MIKFNMLNNVKYSKKGLRKFFDCEKIGICWKKLLFVAKTYFSYKVLKKRNILCLI